MSICTNFEIYVLCNYIAPGSTMDLMLNSINRSRATSHRNGSQYDTPVKSRDVSALYETIDGYQKQTSLDGSTVHPWQQQEYPWKLQQCNFESKRSGGAMEADISYQEMHSAGEHGIAIGYRPNHVMMRQELQKPNNSHAFQVESHATAAGSISCPVGMSHSDSDTDFPHSQSFGDHLSTTAVVGRTESEYTFMSQAGTLAGQQSKLTLCNNGCINLKDQDIPSHNNDITDKNGKNKDSSNRQSATQH